MCPATIANAAFAQFWTIMDIFFVAIMVSSAYPIVIYTILAGVLQGSCISPILFTIYINDLLSSTGVKTNLYTVDTMFSYINMGKQHAASQIPRNP